MNFAHFFISPLQFTQCANSSIMNSPLILLPLQKLFFPLFLGPEVLTGPQVSFGQTVAWGQYVNETTFSELKWYSPSKLICSQPKGDIWCNKFSLKLPVRF
jgi:hypothetical protein